MPFEVPKGWEWCKIEDFSYDLVYGTSEKSSNIGKVPVLRMGNINRMGGLDWSDLVYTSNNYDIQKYALRYNDLLFNRTNSSEWVGKTTIYKREQPAIYAGYLIRLRTFIVSSDYINIVMNSPYHRNWCNEVKTDAVNQSNINAQKLSQYFTPLPPLAEQYRIIAETKRWLYLIDIIEQEKADLQTAIKQAKNKILELAIHGKLVAQDPNDEPAIELLKRINPNAEITTDNMHDRKLPQGWYPCKIKDIATSVLGKTLDRSKNVGKFKKYLCAINVKWGEFDFATMKKLQIEDTEFERYAVKRGDLLVCEGGDVGRAAIWNYEHEMYYQNALHRIRFKEGISAYYFFYSLMYLKFTGVIDDACKGVTIKHFTQNVMNSLLFYLPPLAEQRRIVAKINEIFSYLDMIKSSLQA